MELGLFVRQSFLNGPAFSQTSKERVSRDDKAFGPFRHSERDAFHSKENVSTAIASLFAISGPAAIAWRVVAIIIDSVNRVCWRWTRTHVRKEVYEATPSLADLDAAPAVVLIAARRRLVAAFKHRNPRFILRCREFSSRTIAALSMYGVVSIALSCNFRIQTATALRCMPSQVSGVNNFLSAALAAAFPHWVFALFSGIANHRPSPKRFVSQIVHHHNIPHLAG